MQTQTKTNAPSKGVRKQTVVFVRHGIARHNIINPQTGQTPDLTDPSLLDPPLVRDGKFQAVDVGERLRKWWSATQGGNCIELVISSPLTRCLQTASLAFLPGGAYCRGNKEPIIVCVDSIREAYGINYPDQRRKKSFLVVCISATCFFMICDFAWQHLNILFSTLFSFSRNGQLCPLIRVCVKTMTGNQTSVST